MAEYPPQLANESARAYDAFTAYVRLGVERSFERLSQTYPKSVPMFKRWSAQHDWVERARAYDTELSALAAEQHQARYLADLEAHRVRSTEAARGLYTVAGKLLQRLNSQVNTLEISPATLGVLLKAFQTSLDIEAHALGIDQMEETQD
jgi:hypothetical protein